MKTKIIEIAGEYYVKVPKPTPSVETPLPTPKAETKKPEMSDNQKIALIVAWGIGIILTALCFII